MTFRGLLLTLGIVAAFLVVFVPVARLVIGGGNERIDAERLRRTYVALALYESEHDGLPAPNLGLVRRDVDPSDLQSVNDPQVGKAGPFPLDPALPSLPLRYPTRVSWSYRWHWKAAGKPTAALDPRQGVLASWWTGEILRVNVDGSIARQPLDGGTLTFEELFGK